MTVEARQTGKGFTAVVVDEDGNVLAESPSCYPTKHTPMRISLMDEPPMFDGYIWDPRIRDWKLSKSRRRSRWRTLMRREPCSYCGGPGGSIDHIVPLSQGGMDKRWNCAPACRECNTEKGNRSLPAFLASRRI